MPRSPLMDGAQPFFARGGATGVVVMHGFTASPHEMVWLAQHLAAQGHTVYAPRLSAHGTQPEDMSRARYWDWLASAFDALHVLRAQCDRVVVAGLSMGGCIALNVAAKAEVDGVVAMAAPLVLPGFSAQALKVGKRLRPYSDQTDRGPFADYIAQEQARRGEPVLGRVRYGKWSTAALEQLALLMDETLGLLGAVRAPVLALYSQVDAVVPIGNLDTLKGGLTGAAQVESHVYQQSSHILTQDMECEDVFARVAAFVGAR